MKFGLGGLSIGMTAGLIRSTNAAPNAFHAAQGAGGAAGGGVVTTASGDAQFLFFGTRFDLPDHDETLFFGNFQWLADGAQIESTEITNYGPIEGGDENDRELSGLATMNGEEGFAFTVRVLDGGKLGEGQDTLSLSVGPAGSGTPVATPAAVFTAEGTVTAGGVQLIDFVAAES